MGTVIFKSTVGMASPYPDATVDPALGQMSAFGYPAPLKKLHRSLQAALQRIPAKDEEGNPLRDKVLNIISSNGSEKELIDAIAPAVGMEGARLDILEKRISEMTPEDFIVDPSTATPDAQAFNAVKSKVIDPDMKRQAKIAISPGKASDEWDHILDEDGPQF